jgi:hypothetical protein
VGQLTGSWDSMMWFCLFYRQKGFLLFMTTANVLSWLGLSSFLLWGRYAHSLIHPYLNDRLHPDIDFQCTKKDKIHEIDCAITSAFAQTWPVIWSELTTTYNCLHNIFLATPNYACQSVDHRISGLQGFRYLVTCYCFTNMQPPCSFLVTMEEYIREAPRASITSKSVVSLFTISRSAKK